MQENLNREFYDQNTIKFHEKYKNSNFITKHWVGYYSLPIAYWIISFATAICLTISSQLIFSTIEKTEKYNPFIIFFGYIFYITLFIAISIWHIVGTWRSATKYANNPHNAKKNWGFISKFFLTIGTIRTTSSLIEYIPIISALFSISFLQDPSIPNYKISIDKNFSEIIFQGGIKYGASEDLDKILSKEKNITTINFESIGGRIGEAEHLFNVIKKYQLNTVTNSYCLSACTIAFAAGKERWLGPTGKLGFHSTSFEVIGDQAQDLGYDVYQKIFGAIKSSANFINNIIKTPNSSMWYPDRDILLREHIITSKSSKALSSISIIEQAFKNEFSNVVFPIQLDNVTSQTGIRIEGYKLTYVFEIIDSSDNLFYSFNDASMIIKSAVIKDVCKNEDLKRILDFGGQLGYEYFSKKNHQKIAYFEIDNCKE